MKPEHELEMKLQQLEQVAITLDLLSDLVGRIVKQTREGSFCDKCKQWKRDIHDEESV